MVPFAGFLPDLDERTPGIITDCENVKPITEGFISAPSAVGTDYPALGAACQGSAMLLRLDGSYRLFAGTATALYEGSNGVWDDVTRTVGGAYNLSTDNVWDFAQFGDVTLAASKSDVIQEINAGTDFADNAGGLKARYIETVAGFVMIADVNDAGASTGTSYGDQSDRWWCSALYDHTDWTPAISTQCTSGRLVDAPGAITGLKRLGSYVVVYKERAMFLGTYVGAPLVWAFQQVPGDVGVLSSDCVVNIGTEHYFIGYDDIYRFDGTRPVGIGSGIRDWFYNDLDKSYRYKIIGTHDRLNSCIYWFYPSGNSDGSLNACLIYNYETGKWGKATYSIESAAEILTGQITYDTLGNYYSTYDDLPEVSYDSPFWQTSAPVLSVFDTAHTLKSLTGVGTSMSITSAVYGDDENFSLLQRVRPRFSPGKAPTSATMTNYYQDESGNNMTEDATTTMTNGKFDVLRSSRWHKFKFDFTGETTIQGFAADNVPSGEE